MRTTRKGKRGRPQGPRCSSFRCPGSVRAGYRRVLLLLLLPQHTGARLHLDLARLRLCLLRQEDAQHAVAALRGDVPPLYGGRHREGAGVASILALDAVIALLLVGPLELAFAAQLQDVSLDLDVDVTRNDLGQVELQRDALAVLEDVRGRAPGGDKALRLVCLDAAAVRLPPGTSPGRCRTGRLSPSGRGSRAGAPGRRGRGPSARTSRGSPRRWRRR